MRKLSADYIFPVSSSPIKNGVVEVDEDGKIISLAATLPQEKRDVEFHKGIIVPGFVNTHCHLELANLKGQIREHQSLTGFISELVPKRKQFSEEQIQAAVVSADEEMLRNGIVAVGDISNTDHSFEQKAKSKIVYHTFIETFDLIAEKAEEKFSEARALQSKLKKGNSSIVPHATYSVSGMLMEFIDRLKQPLVSIHNQETASENELFISGSGALAELMQKAGVDIDAKRREKNPLLFILGRLIESEKILLVHNTFSAKADLDWLNLDFRNQNSEFFLCLCPNANLHIENRLPDIPLFVESGRKITIGTDSYASNKSLSVLDELKTIHKHFPKISFEIILQWATKNGAEFLGMEKQLGTIEKGKKPGLNLLTGMNEKFELSEKISVQKLI
ncbi:MAG TPA: amidohydrolase family protein [Bacteroidia bacterium]